MPNMEHESKNELSKILKYYFKKDTIYGCSSTKEVANEILSVMRYATNFEKPDFYYIKDNVCHICEHFEFDASKKLSRKGSKFKREEIFADKRIDEQTAQVLATCKHNNTKINSLGAFNTTINCELNKNFWKENFIKISNEHYKQLETYAENLLQNNLITKDTIIKNVFVVEDTTEFGGWYSLNNSTLAYPFDFDFGVNQMILLEKIDYFVYLNKSQKQIMIVDKMSLSNLKDNALCFDKTSILFFSNIMSITGLITIPKELFNKKWQFNLI